MTSVLKRIGILTITFALLLSCFTSCTIPTEYETGSETESAPEEKPIEYTLTLTADKSVATRGESVNLAAVLKAEGAEDIPSEDTDFILVSGSEYASITGNILKISETAPDGATITVQAKEGASYSNTVSIKISVPLTAIVISAATDKPTAGQTVVLTKVADPADATQTITWKITEGADIATIAGDALTVSETAEVGATIKVKAVSGDVESNELTLTVRSSVVEIPAESVTITAPTLNPLVGESVVITGQIKPDNSTDSIRYEIADGADFATLSANVLIISKEATAGVVIKVVAYAGNVKSNELVFTVRDNSVAAESIEIFANNLTPLAGQSVVLSKDVKPANTTDKVEWKLIEGADKADIVGDVLIVKNTAVEGDVIKVQATVGDKESNVLEFVVASTEIKATKVTISAEYLNLLPGQTMIIQSAIEPVDSTDDIVLQITEGAQYASFAGNVLIVSENAPAGTVIKVVAKAGTANSNELEFTVRDTSKPATKVEISADNLTPIAGHSVQINYTITPADTTDKLTWVIVEGSEIASMAGNVLVIKADAEKDAVIKVKAVVGNVESEELTFTVRPAIEEIKVESIQISANTEVLRGQTYVVNKIINPNNANQEVVWQFVKGSQFATFRGDAIIISDTAPTGTEITIVAATIDGSVKSNELTFVVQPSQEEINATKFFIDFETPDSIVLDKKGTAALPVIIANIYNFNYELVSDKELEYKVISGAEFLAINASGNNCGFTNTGLKGHGTATIEVSIKGTDIVETVTVKVIVPPDAVVLPEVFAERTDIDYAFSKIDPDTNAAETLSFIATTRGEGLYCQDLSYSFYHQSGKTGDEVAVYADGKITFKMTGKVTVTVSSTSGSYVEASTSYTFMINEGYNVSTFEEANTLLRSTKYNGQIVNFVVLERPVAQAGANAYTYGYSLVPPAALKPQSEQTVADIRGGNSNRLQVVNKNAIINGNNHPIDGSQMRRYTEAELTAWMKATGRTDRTALDNIPSLFSVEAWSSDSGGPADSSVTGKDYIVKLYNLHVIGNASIDYDPNHYNDPNDPVDPSTSSFVGAYNIGISVGSRTDKFDVDYYLEAENMSATGFRNGFNFNGIVDGNVKKLYAGNCYSTGIAVKASLMKLSGLTFGACGATGIELAPDECDKAGINNNQNQQVIIDGEINASNNYNDMKTTYFQNYTISGTPVSTILETNVLAYMLPGDNTAVIDHIRNANGQFIFVSLIFNDMSTFKANTSVVTYPSYQAGGIIDIKKLAENVATTGQIDTTHQFIRVPIIVPMGALGNVQAGTALFYNHNYGK